MQQHFPVSAIATIRERIEREHRAACYALTGLAEGTPKHWFINRRMQRIERQREALARLIGEQASIALVNEVFGQSLPQKPGEFGASDSRGSDWLFRSRPNEREAPCLRVHGSGSVGV